MRWSLLAGNDYSLSIWQKGWDSNLCYCREPGGNDFLRKVDEGEAAKNLREMVRLAKGTGVDVVLIGVPRIGLSLTVPEFYKEIAGEFNIPYEGKILRSVLSKGNLKSDYIHPNAQGYRKMAEAVAEVLMKSGANAALK